MSVAADLSPDEAQQVMYNYFTSAASYPDQFTKLLVAQSGHETNGWTSNVWNTDNNGFGYGYTGTGYRSYDSVEDGLDDLITYIDSKVNQGVFPDPSTITDPNQWAQLLSNAGYYTDTESNYAAGIARWFNDNLTAIAGVSAGLIIFVILGFVLFIKD